MINLIRWLIFGHICKYEIHETMNTIQFHRITKEETIIGKTYIMKCDKCGNMKTKEVNV